MTAEIAHPTRRAGIAAMGERILANEWTGLIAFTLLLGTLHLTM